MSRAIDAKKSGTVGGSVAAAAAAAAVSVVANWQTFSRPTLALKQAFFQS